MVSAEVMLMHVDDAKQAEWLREYSDTLDSLSAVRKIWPDLTKGSQYNYACQLRKKFATELAEAQGLALDECRDLIAENQRKAIENVASKIDSPKEKVSLDASDKMISYGKVVDKTAKVHHLVEYQNAVKAMGFDTIDTTFTEGEKLV